jgi:hypothetical protein
MLARVCRHLYPADLLTMGFAAFLSALACAYAPRIPGWPKVAAIGVVMAAGLPVLAWARVRTRWWLLQLAHDWSLAPLVYVWYRQLYCVLGPLYGGRTVDEWLMAADRWICGRDPPVWVGRLAAPGAQ